MKKTLICVIVVVCVALVGVIGVKNLNLGVDEDITLNVSTIKEILEPASDLVALKYNYAQFDTYEKSKEIKLNNKKVDVPFTKDQIVFTYAGTISLGIDLSQVSYEVDEENKVITCTLPEVKIVAHETDESQFQEFEIKNSFLTKTSWTDFNKISAELKENQEESVLKDKKVIEEVEQNAQKVISSFLKSADSAKDYEVEFI